MPITQITHFINGSVIAHHPDDIKLIAHELLDIYPFDRFWSRKVSYEHSLTLVSDTEALIDGVSYNLPSCVVSIDTEQPVSDSHTTRDNTLEELTGRASITSVVCGVSECIEFYFTVIMGSDSNGSRDVVERRLIGTMELPTLECGEYITYSCTVNGGVFVVTSRGRGVVVEYDSPTVVEGMRVRATYNVCTTGRVVEVCNEPYHIGMLAVVEELVDGTRRLVVVNDDHTTKVYPNVISMADSDEVCYPCNIKSSASQNH